MTTVLVSHSHYATLQSEEAPVEEVGGAYPAPSPVLVVIGLVTDWQPLMNLNCPQLGPRRQLFYKLQGAWN